MNERRKHCRVSGAMVSDTLVRIRPGHEGALLNFSPAGALVEVRRAMPPGTRVDLQLCGHDVRQTFRALVLRCSVRAIAALEGVTYQAAFQFEEPLDMERESAARGGYSVHTTVHLQDADHGSELPVSRDANRSSKQESSK